MRITRAGEYRGLREAVPLYGYWWLEGLGAALVDALTLAGRAGELVDRLIDLEP